MAISKIILNGVTQMDVTQKTVTSASMLNGVTALKNDGTDVTGSIESKSASDLTASGATVTAPAGYYSAAASKAVASGTAGTPTATKGTVSNHSISVTPSVTNTTGYITGSTKTGTAVTVTASELASGNKAITENGTNIDVVGYSTVSVAVPTGSTYTATLTSSGSSGDTYVTFNNINYYTSGDTFTYYAGDTLVVKSRGSRFGGTIKVDDVTVAYDSTVMATYNYTLPASDINIAMSYSTSGEVDITTLSDAPTIQSLTVTPSTSQQTFNSSSVDGYKPVTVAAMPSGSATAPASISGTAASVSTGTNTLTLTKTVSVTPTVSAGYVSSGTAGNSSVSLTASITTKAAATITPTTTNQTIAAGTYLTGIQTIAGDADLVASNIVSGVQIFGVTGNVVLQNYYTGSSAPSSSLGSNGDLYLQTS